MPQLLRDAWILKFVSPVRHGRLKPASAEFGEKATRQRCCRCCPAGGADVSQFAVISSPPMPMRRPGGASVSRKVNPRDGSPGAITHKMLWLRPGGKITPCGGECQRIF